MKRKIWAAIGILFLIFLIVGIVFCFIHPEYVREALDLLLKNEMIQ